MAGPQARRRLGTPGSTLRPAVGGGRSTGRKHSATTPRSTGRAVSGRALVERQARGHAGHRHDEERREEKHKRPSHAARLSGSPRVAKRHASSRSSSRDCPGRSRRGGCRGAAHSLPRLEQLGDLPLHVDGRASESLRGGDQARAAPEVSAQEVDVTRGPGRRNAIGRQTEVCHRTDHSQSGSSS